MSYGLKTALKPEAGTARAWMKSDVVGPVKPKASPYNARILVGVSQGLFRLVSLMKQFGSLIGGSVALLMLVGSRLLLTRYVAAFGGMKNETIRGVGPLVTSRVWPTVQVLMLMKSELVNLWASISSVLC